MSDFEILGRLAALAALTEDEVDAARVARDYAEAEPIHLETQRPSHSIPKLDDDGIRALVSDEARVAILNFEVSSEAYYRKAFETPILPGVMSGITVGIGYDLGYSTPEQVRSDFAGLIPDADIERLTRCCKLKGAAARPRLVEVKDIRVPIHAAKDVYRRVTIPRFGRMVVNTFPNAIELKGHAFGALLSLVYNRGNDLEGDRRREMRAIRDLMAARQWHDIPAQFRAMKRIWKDDPKARGLLKRRDAEAELFARGLSTITSAVVAMNGEHHEAARSSEAAAPGPAELEGDGYTYKELEETAEALERVHPDWKKVVWPEAEHSPDYSHIPDRSLAGVCFQFGPPELELLIEANGFQPSREHGRIVFALRGAELIHGLDKQEPSGPQEGLAALTLREVKPDHKTFRCVIGVYDVERGRVSGYMGSTVPNPHAVATFVGGGSPSNMMLTGCYEFQVGWHQESKPDNKIPGCLVEYGRRKAVLRTRNNHSFDLTDIVDDTMPGDNVHPGKSEGPFPFSSWGCLVLNGSVSPVKGGDRTKISHTGQWAAFRRALGLPEKGTGGHGRKLHVVLLTGLDASIAAKARKDRQSPSGEVMRGQLHRLRQGSRGPRVASLRQALALATGDVFTSEVAAKLAVLQRNKTGAVHGLYAPSMDAKLGLDIFKVELQIATLESRRAKASDPSERDRLAFELGAEREMAGGGQPLSEDAHHEGLLATVTALGSRALISTGSVLLREAEELLKKTVCECDGAGKLGGELRQRVNVAAQASTSALKHVLVSILRQATLSFASYDLAERVVGYILEEIVLPHIGASGDAVVGRIDGGIAWLCSAWSQRIATVHGGSATTDLATFAPNLSVIPEPPARPSSADVARLLGLIESAASGATPDVSGVTTYIHRLRDEMRKGATLTVDEHQRFLDILCDNRVLQQASGRTGRDPYVLMADIETALKDAQIDTATIDHRIMVLCDTLADARIKIRPERIEETVLALRKRRLHHHISVLADRVLTREPDPALLGRIGPHYARSLIDSGKIVAGVEVLHATLERGHLSADLSAEVWGGLGRAHKQIYVNHVKSTSDAIVLERTMGPQLAHAIDAYSHLYDPSRPDRNSWHGINLVALLKRAEADRVRVGTSYVATTLARGLIAAIEPGVATSDDPYLLATLGEAYLSLDRIDIAAKYYADFADHPRIDAFTLNSAVRQLEEVWRLEAGKDGANSLLVGLKAALAQKEGGHVVLSVNERRAIAAATTVAHQEQFESKVRGGKFVPLDYLKRLVTTGLAVAAIKQKVDRGGKHTSGAGETVGTGFLVEGAEFGLSDGRSYLLTNAHVLWDPGKGLGIENTALEFSAAEVVFESDDGKNGVFRPADLIWQSPSGVHDACLVALDRRVDSIKPLVMAPKQVELVSDDGTGKRGTALAVVGHPDGGVLSVGIIGALEEISARLLDKGPKGNSNQPTFLHYSVPTEPGNSGSPVLQTSNWQVVGLHHAGFDETNGRPKLAGKAGTHHANEGICIQCIRDTVAEVRNGKKRKRGWF